MGRPGLQKTATVSRLPCNKSSAWIIRAQSLCSEKTNSENQWVITRPGGVGGGVGKHITGNKGLKWTQNLGVCRRSCCCRNLVLGWKVPRKPLRSLNSILTSLPHHRMCGQKRTHHSAPPSPQGANEPQIKIFVPWQCNLQQPGWGRILGWRMETCECVLGGGRGVLMVSGYLTKSHQIRGDQKGEPRLEARRLNEIKH